MLGRSEFRDSVDKILAGEAVDQDLQSVADWPKEIITPVYKLLELLPRLVHNLEDGTVRFLKTDYLHLLVIQEHIRYLNVWTNKMYLF